MPLSFHECWECLQMDSQWQTACLYQGHLINTWKFKVGNEESHPLHMEAAVKVDNPRLKIRPPLCGLRQLAALQYLFVNDDQILLYEKQKEEKNTLFHDFFLRGR